MSDGQRETRSDGNEKKKVCPPTLCTAKLAPAADDGLLLVLVGRSKHWLNPSTLPNMECQLLRQMFIR